MPAVNTLMGLGVMRSDDPNFIAMPGMHGSYASNMAMTDCDLLIALGVRFDDRVTGRLAAFATARAKSSTSISIPPKSARSALPNIPIVGDVKRVLQKLIKNVQELEPEMRATAIANSRGAPGGTRFAAGWKEHPL